MASVRSQCGQCSVGCGVRAFVGNERHVDIEGDKLHPANSGRLCGRAAGLKDMVSLDGRLLRPVVDGRPVGWDRAIAQAARRMSAIVARHGPGSVALHIGGGLLTEDYYVANKLMKGFCGSAHIHAPWRGMNDRFQRAAFGEDVMPTAYEDIDRADLILLAGAGIARTHPILLDRVQAARADHDTMVILVMEGDGAAVDADLTLTITPGSMSALIAGMTLHCHDQGGVDQAGLARGMMIPPDFWDRLRSGHDVWSVARRCRLSPATIRSFYDLAARYRRMVTLYDEGADAAPAILNAHLTTGRIGHPGRGPFAVTAAANGMGAREVGCVPDMLAAHQDFAPDARATIGRFWGARLLADGPGLGGEDLLRAIRSGTVRALWSIGEDADATDWLREARAAASMSIRASSRVEETDDRWTILLPSPVWAEKDGTVTAMDRLISRQRRLFDLPGEVRPDWWAMTRIAQAMGWGDAFHYERAADIYREHVRLTAYCNEGRRLFNLKRHAPISNPAYDELTPWRWGDVPFDGGHFPTADGMPRLL